MQDGIMNETGDSRYLRSIAGFKQRFPTYDAFVAGLVAGEIPIDLNGINQDGWAQLGTPLNKANLLTDATAALADLGPEATPNEMFAAIVRVANTAKDNAASANSTANSLTTKVNNLITASQTDLTAGSSPLATGRVYLVYE